MFLKCFPSGPFATNAYLVACPKTKKAFIIDPAPESSAGLLQEEDWEVEAILLTHSHWDHTGDCKKLKEKLQIPVYVHKDDKENLEKPGSDGLPLMIPVEGVAADYALKEGDCLELGELKIEVIETPGHTPGGVSFYLPEEGVLLSGDTLFQGSIGNLSFPTANPEAMWTSLKKLEKLPRETKVYPGHGPATTIGDESWLARAKEIFGDES
ncbi:MAG: MBL fold metallo-hydrolase [Candidatus Algichlamydia australiensis]|nr:MBL fold metallo-hydrolase [Chlamydiales bacterium]